MKIFKITIVTILSLSLYACVPLGGHCPDESEQYNQVQVDRCTLSPNPGPCEAQITKYYFDKASGNCAEFVWGGCQGTVPFHSLKECEDCSGTSITEAEVDPNVNVVGRVN